VCDVIYDVSYSAWNRLKHNRLSQHCQPKHRWMAKASMGTVVVLHGAHARWTLACHIPSFDVIAVQCKENLNVGTLSHQDILTIYYPIIYLNWNSIGTRPSVIPSHFPYFLCHNCMMNAVNLVEPLNRGPRLQPLQPNPALTSLRNRFFVGKRVQPVIFIVCLSAAWHVSDCITQQEPIAESLRHERKLCEIVGWEFAARRCVFL